MRLQLRRDHAHEHIPAEGLGQHLVAGAALVLQLLVLPLGNLGRQLVEVLGLPHLDREQVPDVPGVVGVVLGVEPGREEAPSLPRILVGHMEDDVARLDVRRELLDDPVQLFRALDLLVRVAQRENRIFGLLGNLKQVSKLLVLAREEVLELDLPLPEDGRRPHDLRREELAVDEFRFSAIMVITTIIVAVSTSVPTSPTLKSVDLGVERVQLVPHGLDRLVEHNDLACQHIYSRSSWYSLRIGRPDPEWHLHARHRAKRMMQRVRRNWSETKLRYHAQTLNKLETLTH